MFADAVEARDISLASAVIHGDWMSSHERLGRNRPGAPASGASPR
jgi:hypothetical protein